MTNYHGQARQARNAPPEFTRPFLPGITATLPGRPWDCACEWAPEFTGTPGSYQATGRFRLKFVNSWCPVSSHRRLPGIPPVPAAGP